MEQLKKYMSQASGIPPYSADTGPSVTPYPRDVMTQLTRALAPISMAVQVGRYQKYQKEQQDRVEAANRLKIFTESGFQLRDIIGNPDMKGDLEKVLGRPWPTVTKTTPGIPEVPATPAVMGTAMLPAGMARTEGVPRRQEVELKPEIPAVPAVPEKTTIEPLLPSATEPTIAQILLKGPEAWTPQEADVLQKIFGQKTLRQAYGVEAEGEDLGDTPAGEIIPGLPEQYQKIPIKYLSGVASALKDAPTFQNWAQDTQKKMNTLLQQISSTKEIGLRSTLAKQYNTMAYYLNQSGVKSDYLQPSDYALPPTKETITDIIAPILRQVAQGGTTSLSPSQRQLWDQYILRAQGQQDQMSLWIREASFLAGILGDPVRRSLLSKDKERLSRMDTRLTELLTLIEKGGQPENLDPELKKWTDEQLAAGLDWETIKAELIKAGVANPDAYH